MQINRLTVAGVNAQNKPGLYADGLGLYLQIAKGGSKSWIFRYMLAGSRADGPGFGSYSAAEAGTGTRGGTAPKAPRC